MTHTLHRQGTEENLSNDFVMHYKFTKGFNDKPHPTEKMTWYFDLVHSRPLVNSGDLKVGNQFERSLEDMRNCKMYTPHAVFTDEDTVTEVITEIRKADHGLSLTLSGLTKKLFACCDKAGIKPYAIENSLGILGDKSKVQPQAVLDITTMCGHAMVAQGVVHSMIRKIKRGLITPKEAGEELAKPCQCGAFNPVRAAMLLEEACVLHCVVER